MEKKATEPDNKQIYRSAPCSPEKKLQETDSYFSIVIVLNRMCLFDWIGKGKSLAMMNL